jgi:hypothetical protein
VPVRVRQAKKAKRRPRFHAASGLAAGKLELGDRHEQGRGSRIPAGRVRAAQGAALNLSVRRAS